MESNIHKPNRSCHSFLPGAGHHTLSEANQFISITGQLFSNLKMSRQSRINQIFEEKEKEKKTP